MHIYQSLVYCQKLGRNSAVFKESINQYNAEEDRRTSCANFLKAKDLEEYVVLNIKTGNEKVGRIEN